MHSSENTIRRNEPELERQFEGVLDVCYSLSKMMNSMIRSLLEAFKDNMRRLSRGEESSFAKLTHDFAEMLDSFITSKDIKPVYNLNSKIKTTMSKIILLIEDLEVLDLDCLDGLYGHCLGAVRFNDTSSSSHNDSQLKIDFKMLADSMNTQPLFSAGKSTGSFTDKKGGESTDLARGVQLTPQSLLRKIESLKRFINSYDADTIRSQISKELGFSSIFTTSINELFLSFENIIRKTKLDIPYHFRNKISATMEVLNEALLSSARNGLGQQGTDIVLEEIVEEDGNPEDPQLEGTGGSK